MINEFERCVRYGRKARKLSQGDLARIAGVDLGDIARIESGMFVPLSDGTLSRLAEVADVDVPMFFSIYRSIFHRDLKKLQEAEAAANAASAAKDTAAPPPAQTNDTQTDATQTDAAQMNPELAAINTSIMAMPPEIQNSLLQTIQMLVQAQAYTIKMAC